MSSAKRILIVDDDAFIRRPLEFILREEGFEPFTAADGEECLRRAGNVRPDLIFLDVMMPGRDGFAVCGALKLTCTPSPNSTAPSDHASFITGTCMEITGGKFCVQNPSDAWA